jgi:hypothetical protein
LTNVKILLTHALVLVLGACKPVVTTASADSTTGFVWQGLNVTNQIMKQTATFNIPENYAITFNTVGTFEGEADCNSISGT